MDYMTNSMSIRLVMPYDSTHSGHHTTPHLRCRRQCPCPPRARVWYMRRRQQELTRSPGQLRTSDRDPRNRQVHRTLASEPDAPRPFRYRPSISKIPHCNGSHAADEGGRGARGGYGSPRPWCADLNVCDDCQGRQAGYRGAGLHLLEGLHGLTGRTGRGKRSLSHYMGSYEHPQCRDKAS